MATLHHVARIALLVSSVAILLLHLTTDPQLSQVLHNPLRSPFTLNNPHSGPPLPVVLVTAYQHGGSSIVGSVLGRHPAATYLYEPVDAVYMALLRLPRWRFMVDLNFYNNGSVRPLYPSEKKVIECYFERIFQCDFESLPPEMCQIIGQMDGALIKEECQPSCPVFYNQTLSPKLLQSISLPTSNRSRYSGNPCYSSARETLQRYGVNCRRSRFITMKLLRYDMRHILHILHQRKETFLLHVIRDPRGIINSFIRRGWVASVEDLKLLSVKVCHGMAHHLRLIKEAHWSITNRIKVLHYEDFAKGPVVFTERLYRLFSIEVPDRVRHWLKGVTEQKRDHGKFIRVNTTKTASAWKSKLTKEQRRVIDSECGMLYDLFE